MSPHEDADVANGYERVAEDFIASRSRTIGVDIVQQWTKELEPGCRVLDLASGSGVPLTQVLISAGMQVVGADASLRMTQEFRRAVPGASVTRAVAEQLPFRDTVFDGVLAWGLLFLLRPAAQEHVIRDVARILKPGGRFLLTAPAQVTEWMDNLTGLRSVSLGAAQYHRLAGAAALDTVAEYVDAGDNHYYSLVKRGP